MLWLQVVQRNQDEARRRPHEHEVDEELVAQDAQADPRRGERAP